MTKEDKKKDDGIESLFDEADLISSYTDRQAVEDGILFDVTELSKVSPSTAWKDGPFSYVTANLCYSKGYLRDGEEPSIPNFLDLFRTMGEHMRKTGPDDFYSTRIEFPDGSSGTVYAERNMSGRYTLLLPEDR
jgi:hypothetical protein